MYLKSSGFLPEVLAKLRKIDEYTKFNVNSLLEIKVRVFLEKICS